MVHSMVLNLDIRNIQKNWSDAYMYCMNKKFQCIFNEIIGYINKSIAEISESYHIEPPTFYYYKFNLEADKKLSSIIHNYGDELMCTVATGSIDDNEIITDVNVFITMRVVELYEIMLIEDIDINKIKEILYLIVRHEMGHVCRYNKFIGKTKNDWISYHTLADDQISELPKLRKNAGSKSRLKFIIDYNSKVITEADANRNAGITIDDWVRYFNILSDSNIKLPI